jgi:sugar lactone lactonase YvrE
MQDGFSTPVECLWEANAELGEGLTYDPARNRIWFVDIKTRRLFRFDLAERTRAIWSLPAQISAVTMPRPPWTPPVGGHTFLLGVGEYGFAWLAIREKDVHIEWIADPESHLPGNRFNDGKLGPDGRFYAGTMDDSETAASGCFYALDAGGAVAQLDRDFGVTNGPAFSPDGTTIYKNDSALRRTYAYDLSSDGRLSNKRLFHEFSEPDGYPDGMTADLDGNLWIAMWDGRAILRLDRSGNKTGSITVPVQRPTNCVFAGPRRLIFTSAAIGVTRRTSLDGGLFCAHLGPPAVGDDDTLAG